MGIGEVYQLDLCLNFLDSSKKHEVSKQSYPELGMSSRP